MEKLPKLEDFNKSESLIRSWGYAVLSAYPWTELHNRAMEAINTPSIFIGKTQ